MQNVANTGMATFRTGSSADKYMRAAAVSFVGATGMYFWAKDSESSFWSMLFMPVMRRFAMDEEWCHAQAVSWLKRGRGPFDYSSVGPTLSTTVFGKTLDHPIMLGAGLDRHGECIYGCFGLGFSGMEVGSITPQKQAGAGMPRIFRFRADEAIITRCGAPSRGIPVSSFFLEQHREWETNVGYPAHTHLLGVNIAKNRISDDIIDDARIGVKVLSETADYITVTLNHPPTADKNVIPSKPWLQNLLSSCHKAREKLPEQHRKPILLKVSLDMKDEDRKILAEVAMEQKVDGLVLGYGTQTRPGMLSFHYLSRQPGVLVGRPTKDMSTELIADMYKRTKGTIPIIGSGGVSSGADALDKIEAGATLVQLHTALVHHGPGVVPAIKRELALALEDRGYNHISEAVGKAVSL